MKITPISYSNINFGYNKQLNNELKEVLKNYPDREWANMLSAINNQCNDVENKLERISNESVFKQTGKHSNKYYDYLDIFLALKEVLVSYVSTTFEDLHFADREYRHYDAKYKSAGSKPDDWRNDILDIIYAWTQEIPKKVNPQTKESTTTDSKSASGGGKSSEGTAPKKDGTESKQDGAAPKQEAKPQDVIPPLKKAVEDKSILQKFVPSDSSPKGFADVAGMDSVKSELNNGIMLAVKNPEQAILDFQEYGKIIPKGLLLYGPPGCGKTYITQALAMEIGMPMYILDIGQVGSSFINKTSQNIKAAFDEAIKTAKKSGKPCLLFMDEIDSLAFDRNSRTDNEDIKQVAALLQAMDSAKQANVFIIGATNKYNLLDPAIRRRFDSKIFVSVPDFEARKSLIKKQLQGKSKAVSLIGDESAIDSIAGQLNGFSNDSICKIVSSAAKNALERNRADIEEQDFVKAISETSEEKPDVKSYLAENNDSKPKIGFFA